MKRVFGAFSTPLNVVLVLCLLANTNETIAGCPATSDAQPARLLDSVKQRNLVAELVREWESDEDARLIKFAAYVTDEGNLEAMCCVSETHKMNATAYSSLARRLDRLNFLPASHNGRKIRVYAGFTIVATKSSEGVKSILLMNQMHSIEKYGLDHSGPQRIWSESMWLGRSAALGYMYVEIRANVDKFGNASDVHITNQNANSRRFDQHFVGEMESACFIPRFADGIAVDMPYAEAFATY